MQWGICLYTISFGAGDSAMRILHTADWHLGRTLEGRSRIDEQAQFIDELCLLADDTAACLIIVAGDVFDSANPPAAAEELFYDAMSRLSAGGRRAVLVIAGNHDNPERLCAAAPLATKQGVALYGRPGEAPLGAQPSAREVSMHVGPGWFELVHDSERVQVAVLPYPSEARLDAAFVETIADEAKMRQAYSDRVAQALQATAAFSADAIRITTTHLYVAGGIESDSERPIQVGGAFTVSPSAFPAASQYIALGHLHRPQYVTGTPGIARYSGTPLAYNFAEAGQAKSVTLLEASSQQVVVSEVHLGAGRPLVRWKAPYGMAQVEQWCADGRDSNAWVELEIHLDAPLTPDETAKLKRMHRGLVIIRPVFTTQTQVAAAVEDRQGVPVPELFRLFYASRRNGAAPAPETMQLFLSLLESAAGQIAPGSEAEDAASPLNIGAPPSTPNDAA